MTTALAKYHAAKRALTACKSVDEVKDIHDKAEAMRLYGQMSKDKTLEMDAAEIRIRAERRLGELIAAQKATVGLNKGGRPSTETPIPEIGVSDKPSLADAGISYVLSSRAQHIAAVPEAEFEAEVGEWRERVSAEGARVTTRLVEAGKKAKAKEAPAMAPDPDMPTAAEIMDEQQAEILSLQAQIDALSASDQGAELRKQLLLYKHAVREKDVEMDKNARLHKENGTLSRFQSQVVEASGAGSPKAALQWVRAMAQKGGAA